jgi:hypothetical protein
MKPYSAMTNGRILLRVVLNTLLVLRDGVNMCNTEKDLKQENFFGNSIIKIIKADSKQAMLLHRVSATDLGFDSHISSLRTVMKEIV